MTKDKYEDDSKEKADLILVSTTVGPPLQGILQEASNTASLNFITWDKAFSLFPLSTFIWHKVYVRDQCAKTTQTELRQMGWTLVAPYIPNPRSPSHPVQHERRVGDRRTWSIVLNTDGIQSSKTPDSIIENSFFSMHGLPFRTNYPRASVGVHISTFKTFEIKTWPLQARYTYLISYGALRPFILARLKDFTDTVPSLDGTFDDVHIWKYSEEQYTEWCNAYEQAEEVRRQEDVQQLLT